ncbi:MAG: hypothetical protein PHP52_10435 [Bacteroidales bacterium]|nr:hypothetical protein [Bacteroidales bacterium]MDD4217309.1 hypothetical protein [Bacteroidales bacterium]MDY0142567.1 hypothetical protein [Bacteroidales bacterium]
MTTKIKNIWKLVLKVSLILVISLVLIEITLGIYFKIKDRNLIHAEVIDYPYLYFKLTEDSDFRNEDGLKIFREKTKPDTVFRIIISGGSVVYGLEPENTISANLERLLNDSLLEVNIEVLNAGVPAYVIEQEFILVQLVLQYYNPDMIISLDGYNDLISTEINRFYPCEDLLPPHNWRDFRLIKYHNNVRRLSGRFYGAFTNINRLSDFAYRNFSNKKDDFAAMSANKQYIAKTYRQRTNDLEAFCQAKDIVYYHFLQPVRFISNNSNNREKHLEEIYKCMNDSLINYPYYKSLIDIFDNNDQVYTDECHVDELGNKKIAMKMFNVIFPVIKNEFLCDSLIIK